MPVGPLRGSPGTGQRSRGKGPGGPDGSPVAGIERFNQTACGAGTESTDDAAAGGSRASAIPSCTPQSVRLSCETGVEPPGGHETNRWIRRRFGCLQEDPPPLISTVWRVWECAYGHGCSPDHGLTRPAEILYGTPSASPVPPNWNRCPIFCCLVCRYGLEASVGGISNGTRATANPSATSPSLPSADCQS
jgi:hypothetical protein